MKDRYLFKAKRVDDGEWVQGCYIYDVVRDHSKSFKEFAHRIQPLYAHAYAEPVDPTTICQCTGLKDRNGNLIWENDIVNFLGHKGTIVFECGSFGIAYKAPIDWRGIEANILPITGCDNVLYACANDNFISLWEIYWNFNDEDDCLSTVEVVGNIFDNPELLESEG